MAHLENIRIYPVKGLDAMDAEAARLTGAGTLAGDREYAMVDPAGETRNGKQIDRLHELSTTFDPETNTLALSVRDTGDTYRFDLTDEREAASEWFGEFADEPIELRRREPPSFVDRTALGPSVIATETLEEVASWFDGMTPDGARRRFRPNLEIGDVPPFWEDRFLGEGPSEFEISGVRFEGAEACARCVVPTRDPDTGESIEGFRRRFVERRKETLPTWVDADAFRHFYAVMLITKVPEVQGGETIRIGDSVSVEDELNAWA